MARDYRDSVEASRTFRWVAGNYRRMTAAEGSRLERAAFALEQRSSVRSHRGLQRHTEPEGRDQNSCEQQH
jgi:hypothetical protein